MRRTSDREVVGSTRGRTAIMWQPSASCWHTRATVTWQYNLLLTEEQVMMIMMLCGWEGNRGPAEKYWPPAAGFMTKVTCGMTAYRVQILASTRAATFISSMRLLFPFYRQNSTSTQHLQACVGSMYIGQYRSWRLMTDWLLRLSWHQSRLIDFSNDTDYKYKTWTLNNCRDRQFINLQEKPPNYDIKWNQWTIRVTAELLRELSEQT